MTFLYGDEEVAEETQVDAEAEGNDAEGAQPTVEELLASRPDLAEAIARQAQSEADKRLAAYQAKLDRERRAAEKNLTAQQRAKKLEEALDEGDTDTAKSLASEEKLRRAARIEVLGEIEDVIKTHPYFAAELGEDTVAALFNKTLQENGTLIDWLVQLSDEKQTRQVTKLREDIQAELQKEFDAKLVEAGVEIRSNDDTEGRSISEALVKGGSAAGRGKGLIQAAADGADVPFKDLLAELRKGGFDPLSP